MTQNCFSIFRFYPNGSFFTRILGHTCWDNSRKTFQIEQPADHESFLPNILKSPSKESPETMFFFGFSPKFLDLFSGSLAPLIKTSPLSHPNPLQCLVFSSSKTRDMWLNASLKNRFDKLRFKITFVGSQRRGFKFQSFLSSVQKFQGSLPFRRRTLALFHADADKDSVPVFHDRIHRVSRNSRFFWRFCSQASVRIAGGSMSLVRTSLPFPIYVGIARVIRTFFFDLIFAANSFLIALGRLIHFYRRKTLVARVGSNKRTVHAPMCAHQSFGHGLLPRIIKQSLQNSRLVKPVFAVLRKAGGIPYGRVDIKPYKPSKSHIALKLHDQFSIRSHPQKVSSDKGQKQLLRWYAWPPVIFAVKWLAKLSNTIRVYQRANLSQRMLFRYKIGYLDRVKYLILSIGGSHHSVFSPSFDLFAVL